MKKRITLILPVVAACVFAAVAPGAANAWTSSNPAAPDSPTPSILGAASGLIASAASKARGKYDVHGRWRISVSTPRSSSSAIHS